MEIITVYEGIFFVNIVIVMYLSHIAYLRARHKSMMSYTACHHLLSHAYIGASLAIGANLFIYFGNIIPLLGACIYVLSHLVKENLRLVRSGFWTPGIKDI